MEAVFIDDLLLAPILEHGCRNYEFIFPNKIVSKNTGENV